MGGGASWWGRCARGGGTRTPAIGRSGILAARHRRPEGAPGPRGRAPSPTRPRPGPTPIGARSAATRASPATLRGRRARVDGGAFRLGPTVFAWAGQTATWNRRSRNAVTRFSRRPPDREAALLVSPAPS